MAGSPKKRERRELITDKLVHQAHLAVSTPVEYLQDWFGDGRTMEDLADALGCTRSHLSRSLNAIPEYKEALERGREINAERLADEALKIVDDLDSPDVSKEQIQVAKLRMETGERVTQNIAIEHLLDLAEKETENATAN